MQRCSNAAFCWLQEDHISSVAFHHFEHISNNFILLSGAYLLIIHDIKSIEKEKNNHRKINEEGKVSPDPQGTIKEV